MTALIIVGILVLIGLGIWYSWYAKKKRREELAIAAKQLGLQYSQADTFGCLALPFGLFRKGDGRGTENVLWGAWQGIGLREFDYWYYEESTDSEGHTSRSYSYFSCVVTQIPLTASPLSVTKENIFTRFADHVGLRDIEFESERFNREFNVKSKDRKFANDVIDARMMQWLLQSGERYAFEMSGPFVLVYCKRLKPLELTPLLGTLQAYVDHVPRVAYSLYGDPAKAAELYGAPPVAPDPASPPGQPHPGAPVGQPPGQLPPAPPTGPAGTFQP
jgi:type II secretory pathway pseudopilin PulG